jgi:hypothetical protein
MARSQRDSETTRSRAALEAMCVSVVRRIPGMEKVQSVSITEALSDGDEPNWAIDEVSISPALDAVGRRRVEEALESWRQRFRLA